MATNPPCEPCFVCGGKLDWEPVPRNMAWPWEPPRFGPTEWRPLPHICPPEAVKAWVDRVFDKSPPKPFFTEIKPVTELEQAQADYNTAVNERTNADKAVNDAYRKVVAAKDRLDEAKRAAAAAIPVDRSQRTLTDGSPVTEDHREINPATGQQKGYVVLSGAERAKGFVRPYRDAYRHAKCGAITTMGRTIAETYARDPHFYNGTFCSTCRAHFPVGEDGEFTWYEMDGTEGPKVGT